MLIPIDEVVHFDVITSSASTGAVTDADSTPTFDVYEEATDTGMLGATNLTKRTSLTGNYRGTFTASAANGFEAGKWYSVVASATVSTIAGKCVAMSFRCVPAETSAGVPKVDISHYGGTAGTFSGGRPEVNTTHLAGTAYASADLSTTMKASVNAEVVDTLVTDTYAEPGSVPAATASLKDKIGWMEALARNKITQTSTTQTLRNDADSGNIATSTVSDDGTTFTRGEFA